MTILRALVLILAAALMPAVARAEDPKVPYWASIRAGEVNMRAGPGEDYRIDWVYRRPQLPIKVLRTMEGWRLVQDPDGARGWMLARFLTRERTAFVQGKGAADMREEASDTAKLLWRVKPGVIGLLGDCGQGWCAVTIGGRKGFVEQSRLWGAGEP